jgi:hypothetical protein
MAFEKCDSITTDRMTTTKTCCFSGLRSRGTLRGGVPRVSRDHLELQYLGCFLVQPIHMPVDGGEIFRVLLIANRLGDVAANGPFDKIGAVLGTP